jgi:Zn-dependent M28 family amino/carboxypeptidase
VIAAAHYDHLGIGPPVQNDSIYNGAFDNASGVAAVLELARIFSHQPQKPLRSILFIFLTGEESGRIGSRYYCEYPLVPLHKTIAALNVDGLALFERFKEIIGVGAELSTLRNELSETAFQLGLQTANLPRNFSFPEPLASSDHFSFMEAGIPSVLISEGLRYESSSYDRGLERFMTWGAAVYHTPFDDLYQPMDFCAARQHLEVLTAFLYTILNTPIDPQWLRDSPYINARLQSIAEKK